MRVLAICGSLRRASYNRQLLEAAALSAPQGMRIEPSAPLGSLPLFDEDLEERTGGGPEPLAELRRAVAGADGLLIATPEYNHSFPGALKNALDWLSRPAPEEVLAGKPVALMGATTGRWGTRLAQSGLRQVLYATGALPMPPPALFVSDAARVFDSAGRLCDGATQEALQELLISFEQWIRKTRR